MFFPTTVGISIDDNTQFLLTFPGNFVAQKTYRLNIVAGFISNQQGDSVQLLSMNYYVMMDVNCSSHGELDNGMCFCCNGYAGPSCSYCDDGYIADPIAAAAGNLSCLQKTGNICTAGTCSCDPNVQIGCYGQCSPIGQCNDGDGSCNCPINYAGVHCEICASGYIDWNSGCIKLKTCTSQCVRGTCNEVTGNCECPDHWAGSACDECSAGWSGDNCDNQISVDGHSSDIAFDKTFHNLNIFAIVLAVIAILCTISYLLYRRYGKGGKAYSHLDQNQSAELSELGISDEPDHEEEEEEEVKEEEKEQDVSKKDATVQRLMALDD